MGAGEKAALKVSPPVLCTFQPAAQTPRCPPSVMVHDRQPICRGLIWWCVAQVSSVKLNTQLAELTALVRSPLEETARRKVADS